MIRAIRNFQWAEAWTATKLLLMLSGAIGLVVWLGEPMPWWLTAATLFIVGICWFLCFHIVCSWGEHKARRTAAREHQRIDRVIGRLSDRAPLGPPAPRRRFVRFDPDTGTEIYKWEPGQ